MKTVVAAILLIHATGCRVVPLHALSTISGHAVLQAGKPFSIQGWATPGATVSALFRGQDYHAKVNSDSRWKIDFPPQSVGKGSDLILSTEREMQVFHDVAVGEVWVCSGQSNMEFHLGWTTHAQEDVATSADPDLRMFTVAHAIADSPARDVSGDWKVSGPEAAYDFSAACYFFGKELRRSLGVPVGLIHSAWGGAPAESWTTKETLAADTLLAPVLQPGAHPDDLPYPERRPVMLYNGMIAPLGATTIRGIAWYQGESNAYRAYQYRALLPAMIGDWRKVWRDPSLPFEVVQLPNFRPRQEVPSESDWAELREAQLATSQRVPGVGLTVTIDLGVAEDIHPHDKTELGRRLAWSALNHVYGYKGGGPAPVFQRAAREGAGMRLVFDRPEKLRLSNGTWIAKGFAIAGEDHRFHWAKTVLEEDGSVLVSSAEVPEPVAVRYAWADNPEANLVSGDGIPVSPFRTDSWPGITDLAR